MLLMSNIFCWVTSFALYNVLSLLQKVLFSMAIDQMCCKWCLKISYVASGTEKDWPTWAAGLGQQRDFSRSDGGSSWRTTAGLQRMEGTPDTPGAWLPYCEMERNWGTYHLNIPKQHHEKMETLEEHCTWCGRPSDRGWLRTEQPNKSLNKAPNVFWTLPPSSLIGQYSR